MIRDAYIISSDKEIGQAQAIVEYANKSGKKATLRTFKRIDSIDLAIKSLKNSVLTETTIKNYLKDGVLTAAAILTIKTKELNSILSKIPENSTVYICEEHIPEYFYLKKLLFKGSFDFYSFGNIVDSELISLNNQALDIGIKLDTVLKTSDTKIDLPDFNGSIAIDPPPDAIPYSHLGYFRSPLNLVKNLISFLDAHYKNKRHPAIRIIVPQENDPYKYSKRASEIVKLLGKRCETVRSFSDLDKNSSVITWSTQQFFKLLSSGFRPAPATKCGASFPFRKSKNIGQLILDTSSGKETDALIRFYRENSL